MDKLTLLRESYRGFNDLPIGQRIARSKPIERWIRDTMNHHGTPWNGLKINNWQECNSRDDRQLKRDAQAEVNGETVYSQIKFRQPDSGTDIGCAIIQPYPGSRAAMKSVSAEGKEALSKIFARDYKFDGILYVVLDNAWEKLMLVPFEKLVKYSYSKVLKEWWLHPDKPELNNYNRVFRSKEIPWAELRWKKDSGRNSYDSGLEKILCYLPISIFAGDSRVTVVDMIEPPDYLFGG